VNAVIRLNQVRDAVKIIHSAVGGAWSRIPSLSTWIRMSVKLANHHQTGQERRGTEINGGR
jgi:hypothetical protein